MSGTRVFWLEPTDLQEVSLRRYRGHEYAGGVEVNQSVCPGPWSYHNTSVPIVAEEAVIERLVNDLEIPHDDPRWPQTCPCGYEFRDEDQWQVNSRHLYRAGLDGKLYTLQGAPPGAMWDATWYREGHGADWSTGPDGLCLIVRLPNGSDWVVDEECSNCTRTQWESYTDDKGHTCRRWTGRTHACWPRKGDPRTGYLDIRKEHGETCSAGAGSVIAGDWHGWLHAGHLIRI